MLEAGEQAADASGEKELALENADLAGIALPAASIKRIVRSAAPGVRFSSEAIAGFHRVAQAFALFATDRSLAEQTKEIEKAKKAAKSKQALPRKTLTAEHVMRFLSAELPPIASKVSTLFPDLMPTEFKPAGVLLLEQLHEQSKGAAVEATSVEQSSLHFKAAAAGHDVPREAPKREREENATESKEVGSKPSSSKKAKTSAAPVQSASLSKFFGSAKVAPKDSAPVTQEQCAPKDSPPATELQADDATQIKEDEETQFEDAQPREVC